jgi:hypothetical protein
MNPMPSFPSLWFDEMALNFDREPLPRKLVCWTLFGIASAQISRACEGDRAAGDGGLALTVPLEAHSSACGPCFVGHEIVGPEVIGQ